MYRVMHVIIVIIICSLILCGGFALVDTVGLVVLGHFSLDGQLKKRIMQKSTIIYSSLMIKK